MDTSNRIKRLVDDLAAYWTEPVLEILKTAGKAQASVQSELETWHALSTALQTELREQRAFGSNSSLGTVQEQVIARASSDLAQQLNLPEEPIRQVTGARRLTPAEHRLFGELVQEPASQAAFKTARQTDFMPRLQVAG